MGEKGEEVKSQSSEKTVKGAQEKVGGVSGAVGDELKNSSGQSGRPQQETLVQALSSACEGVSQNQVAEGALRSSVKALTCGSSWKDLLELLKPVQNWFLTKEDEALLHSYTVFLESLSHIKALDYLCINSNWCQFEKLLKVLTVKKIGNHLLKWKELRINALVKVLEGELRHAEAWASVANTFVSNLVTAVVKPNWSAVGLVILGIITAQILRLNYLENRLQGQLYQDEFCVKSCSKECLEKDGQTCVGKCAPDPDAPPPEPSKLNAKLEEISSKLLDLGFKMIEKLVPQEVETARKLWGDEELVKELFKLSADFRSLKEHKEVNRL